MDNKEPNYEYNRGWADAMAVRAEHRREAIGDVIRLRSVLEELRSELHLLMIDDTPLTTEQVAKRFERIRDLRDRTQLPIDMTTHYTLGQAKR